MGKLSSAVLLGNALIKEDKELFRVANEFKSTDVADMGLCEMLATY